MASVATSGLVLLGSSISRGQFNAIKRASGKQKEAALAAIVPAGKPDSRPVPADTSKEPAK